MQTQFDHGIDVVFFYHINNYINDIQCRTFIKTLEFAVMTAVFSFGVIISQMSRSQRSIENQEHELNQLI